MLITADNRHKHIPQVIGTPLHNLFVTDLNQSKACPMPRRYCIRALEDTRATSRDVIGRGLELKWLLTETVSAPRWVVDGGEGFDEPRVGGAQLPRDGRERLERRRNVDRACKRRIERITALGVSKLSDRKGGGLTR